MSGAGWERLGAATGIGSFAFILAGIFSSPSTPDEDDPPQEWVTFFLDSGNRNRTYLALILLAFGILMFLWFLGSLRTTLRRAEGDPGRLAGVAFGGGVVFAALMLMFAAGGLGVPGAIDFFDRLELDGNTIMLLQGTSFWFFAMAGIGAAVMIAASSVLAFRSGAFPTWFGGLGFLLSLGALATFIFVGIFAVLLWLLIAAIIVTARAGAVPPA